MRTIRAWIVRLCSLFRKQQQDREFAEELESHLALHIEDNVRSGMSPKEARRNALIKLGGVDKTIEKYRDRRGFNWLEDLVRDAGYGVRGLLKSPGFTTVAVLILALGIGANTAIFSLIDAVISRPLPFSQPGRLVRIDPGSPISPIGIASTSISFPDFYEIKNGKHFFSGVAAYIGYPLAARNLNAELLSGRGVSADFFQVLGLKMAAGRGFLPGEDALSGSNPVVVISYRYWQREYQLNPSVIGKPLSLNNELLTIVGVAPKNCRDIEIGGNQDVWVTFPQFGRVMHMDQTPDWLQYTQNRDMVCLSGIARIREGYSLEQAQAGFNVLAANFRQNRANSYWGQHPTLYSMNRMRWPEKRGLLPYAVLAATAVCILLLTCMNVANLLLSRGSARRREIGLRYALGACRARIFRQLMTEGLILSIIATLVSLFVCKLTLNILPVLRTLYTESTPLVLDLSVDQRVLLLAIFIGLCTNIFFALAPAFMTSRADVSSMLKDNQSFSSFPAGSKLRRFPVAAQIALSVMLLIAAGLFARTILRFELADLGYDRNVLLFKFEPADYNYDAIDISKGFDFYNRSLEQIRQMPGVIAASWAVDLPLDEIYGWVGEINRDQVDPVDRWLGLEGNSVTSGYFKTVGIPILQGRDFSDRDTANALGAVIVNESLARRFWPGTIPLGKRIHIRESNMGSGGNSVPSRAHEVVGVAKDVKYRALNEQSKPYIYLRHEQGRPNFHMELHIKTAGDPRSFIEPVRQACARINPKFAIYNPRLMSEHLDLYLSQEKAAAFVLGIFGPLSLILAAVGLYGIISYSITQRLREFGIRAALGARPKNILMLILHDGMVPTLLGLAVGLPASVAVARLLSGHLHGLSPLDPMTYLGISVLCVVVTTATVLLSARRIHSNPSSLLRES
jgi:macrolide transport system ATP-binding/permease protein